MRKILYTSLITLLVLVIVLATIGGGHGTFLVAKLIYPCSMIIAVSNDQIGIAGIILAILQIPIYVMIISKRPKLAYQIFGIHMVAIIIVLNMSTEAFSG
ncbi:hypothetical protein [Flagellimonas flava]|uniref:hypothetical protein n=1 Tax=Flagellimonas flava TaxID=570519 RepID=UPI003D6515AE